ncbi:MAG: hypothetical protein P8M77_01245 [Porticoccaceae bacterium]|nr:hypothetical protein [Porticoccaceae bacterium]
MPGFFVACGYQRNPVPAQTEQFTCPRLQLVQRNSRTPLQAAQIPLGSSPEPKQAIQRTLPVPLQASQSLGLLPLQTVHGSGLN